MKQKNEKGIFIYVTLKLLLAFCTLLAMQVMFYLCNTRVIHVADFGEWMGILWGNIRFGLATIATFFLPFTLMLLLPINARWKRWYRIIAEVLYIVPILIILIARGCNTAYYQYTYRLLSDEIFSYLGISGQGGSLAPHFAVDYWYAWVVPLILFIVFLIVNSKLHLRERNEYAKNTANNLTGLCIGMLLMVLFMRGGFGHFIQPADAARHCDPKNSVLVNNDGYNILRTLFTPDMKETAYMSDAEAKEIFDPEFIPLAEIERLKAIDDSTYAVVDTTTVDSAVAQRNVVLIILESFGQEFMGCYNHTGVDTRTPFLDSLAQFSTLYNGRSNGKKSIEGITAITTSIPNLSNIPLTNSAYQDDQMAGIATALKRHGYYCGFFHGTYNGVMNFDRTCARTGFDEYLGKNEYEAEGMGKESDYDGVWGIYDEPFLQYTLRRVNTYKEPFLVEVFTVTSHHPFPIPEEHKGEFKEGRHPILKCVEYTDYSLRRFFEEAKKQPWYDNTLFIITGDHSGHGLSREYNDYDGWYRIPMMVYDPQNPVGRVSPRIVQHTDILPSLIDHLGLDERMVCFGTSVVQHPECGWQIYYGNDFYCMVSNNPEHPEKHDITVLSTNGSKEIGTPENLKFLKAVVQQFNKRVITDNLIIK